MMPANVNHSTDVLPPQSIGKAG